MESPSGADVAASDDGIRDQTMAATGLSFARVTFRYRSFGPDILDDFTWVVPKGRTVLLGPNGAGKSTVMMLGADARSADRGTIHLDALRAGDRRTRRDYRRSVGWMPQHIRAVPGLTSREQVTYAGWLKGMGRSDAWRAALGALTEVGLQGSANKTTSALSGGQLRRVGLAQALVHNSAVLLLDEPSVGLDPDQRGTFRDILRKLPGASSIVVSTHQVDDLSELFDTVVVISDGTVCHQSSVAEFMRLAPADSRYPAEDAYRIALRS